MILIIRLLPFLVGLLEAGLFWWQGSLPGTYPLLVVAGVILLPLASGVIAWKQVRLGDLVEKMAPAFLLLAVLGFALLLSEGWWPRLLITALAVVFSFLSLELLFLLARDPGSYPVNGPTSARCPRTQTLSSR